MHVVAATLHVDAQDHGNNDTGENDPAGVVSFVKRAAIVVRIVVWKGHGAPPLSSCRYNVGKRSSVPPPSPLGLYSQGGASRRFSSP